MNSKIAIACHVLALAALLAAPAVFADDGIRVDVVVDLTGAGKKIPPPTPDKPAYYLPVTAGFKQQGAVITGQKPPPPSLDIQRLLAQALYARGYRLATRSPPSLVLVFWWGYMAPEDVEMQSFDSFQGGRVPAMGLQSNGAMGSSMLSLGSSSTNQGQMLALVRGDKPMEDTNPYDPRMREALDMAKRARYYILIAAFDFESWRKHKPIVLWRAHISTDLAGHDFDQVVSALITVAAPMLGQDTNGPQLVGTPIIPLGQVVIGMPVVRDYPAAPSPDKKP